MTLWAVGTLGITARSSYMQAEDNMTMPPLNEAGGGGGVAAEIVQTTLDHFGEPMIAGKTHSEILSMKYWTRCRWYKTISPDEKTEVMRIVTIVMRAKQSASKIEYLKTHKHPMLGTTRSEETRQKISKAMMGQQNSLGKQNALGYRHTDETRQRLSKSLMGNLRALGYKQTEEHIRKKAESNRGKKRSDETRQKMSKAGMGNQNCLGKQNALGNKHTDEWKELRSKAMSGEKHPNFNNWASREPYCHLWDKSLKEKIRNRDNRTCVLCGKSEIQNGQRLSVHHIDADKMQGCNHKNWYLCALCRSCNTRPDTVEKEFLIVTGGSSVQ